jgi:hypothetical protein
MLTPDGKDCPYFYANFHRRTSAIERCNLIAGGSFEQDWHAGLCESCPVPQIKRSNNCPTMQLSLRINKRGMKFWENTRIVVIATCTQSNDLIENPMIGCGKCHNPITFVVGKEDGEA